MSSKIDNIGLDSIHGRLEIPDFLINEKDHAGATNTNNKNTLSNDNHSNSPEDSPTNSTNRNIGKEKVAQVNLDSKLIQAIREAGL